MNVHVNNTEFSSSPNVPALLAYNGTEIHARKEMLSLTDMWKSAGSDPARQPANWLASAEAARFIEFLGEIVNPRNSGIAEVGNPHFGLVKTIRGGRTPGSWAHWQIALAYAKYLSPEFHMWCNTVVRERMEGHRPATALVLDDATKSTIGGIVKNVMRANLPDLIGEFVEQAINTDPRRSAVHHLSVRQILDEAKAQQKGRKRINLKIGYELRARASLSRPPVTLYRCAHSGVWLYPREFAMTYMAERGLALVKEHNDRVAGQGLLKLVRSSVSVPAGEARQ